MIINDNGHLPESSEIIKHLSVLADGSIEKRESRIVKEHAFELYVNEALAAKLVCTPSELVELVVGRMVSEGMIRNVFEIDNIYVCESGNKVKVFLKENIVFEQHMEQIPTCCTDNKILLQKQNSPKLKRLEKVELNNDWIFKLAGEFANGSKIHKATKGTHSCYLACGEEIIFACEDIGRHNAMDKAIGYAVMNDYDRTKCILFTSGRVPIDMVRKVIAAEIPVLASKAVPTKEAVEMAQEYNLNLICMAWPDRFEIFNQAK